jgi:L-alanine-DL-glutamate epimerase-like enolase superfamily enzyme
MATKPILTWERLTLRLRNPFRLSYGVSETRQAFWLRLDGDEGWGEGTIPPYYGVASEAMIAFWQAASLRDKPLPEEVEEIEGWTELEGPAPARCALELAFYDRLARRRGLPLWQLLGLPRPDPRPTSFTIAIDSPEAMARMAAELSSFPVIKVKLGGDEEDEARLSAIREARPDAHLRVDANAGWTLAQASTYVRRMEAYELEMIEQPLAREAIAEMGLLQSQTAIPVVADESVQTMDDVERLADAGVSGINVKLMKVGGLGPALRLIHRARERGLRVMLGCMVETSLGTTAMAHLMGLAEWFDLDAPMLIANDPFEGVAYCEGALIQVPDRPGIGVERREA